MVIISYSFEKLSMEIKEFCNKYLAFLRSLYLIHQTHHWLTQGSSFYGDHLLFERIYKSAAENADLIAEKFVGLFGQEIFDCNTQAELIEKFLKEYSSNEQAGANSLKAESEFLKFSKEFYEFLKENDKMTLGLDDAIMQIASERETSVYLLKSKLGSTTKLSRLARNFKLKLNS